jgi:hypothetical protein
MQPFVAIEPSTPFVPVSRISFRSG